MKSCNSKTRNLIRPSPNEEAAIVQSEQERRKKIRLKQVREQEKAFALKIRQNIKNKKDNELKILSEQLKEQWTEKQKTELSNLEKRYQKNLDKVGDGHTAAIKDQDTIKKDGRVLSKEDRQRAIERHNQAVIQFNLERARSQQAENDRAAARAKATEAEKARAAMVASLPPSRDLIQEFELKEEQKRHPKSAEDFKSTRYHLQQPAVQVERMSKEGQVDARVAAVEEEDKIHGIREETQRSEAEQAEKARLRHKHALAQLKIEEDRKKLMEDLSELERLDRQRRQDAVARIPVRIFQPPHKRLEDEEERQRDLEQAFEDMYMVQTGYTGDLTIALEPSTDPMTIPEEHQPQVPEEKPEKPPAAAIPSVTIPQDRDSADGCEREREKSGESEEKKKMEHKEERMRESAPPKGEDAVKRLLLRIPRQREQGKTIKDQPPAGQQPQQPQQPPPTSRTTARATGSRVNILTPLPEEEEPSRDEDTSRTAPPEPHPTTTVYQDVPGRVTSDSSQPLRALLHPYEVAQQVRMIGPQRTEEGTPSSESDGSVPESPSSQQQPELLEQQRLKLKLQEQRRIQERLEEQLNQYHRQFQKISSEIPKGPYATRDELSPQPRTRIIHEPHGLEYIEEPDSFDQINVPTRHISDEVGQRDQDGDHVIGSESLEEGSTISRTSGTISLEEQTPDEEGTSQSSKSTSDYATAGATGVLPRGSLEGLAKTSLDVSTLRVPLEHDNSSSDESQGYIPQRGTAPAFLPLEWQRDNYVGPRKPSGPLTSKFQEYPLNKANHETTGETAPPESSNESGERLESDDLTSSSDSSNGMPHGRLSDLLQRNKIQSFGQSDSGFVPTLPFSSLSATTERTKTSLDSVTSHKKVSDSVMPKTSGQVDTFLPTSSYSGDSKVSSGSSSLRERQENVPSGTIYTIPSSAAGQTTPSYSRLLDGSPNYLDEYRSKWEEEKKLIENQRQLIRQKQEHQLRRMRYYQDILERYEKNSHTSLDMRPSKSIHPRAVATDVATITSSDLTSLVSDSFKSQSDSSRRKTALASANKENESFYANSVPRVPPLVGLKGSSSSSDNSAFTRISYPWTSSSSSHSGKKLLATSKSPLAGTETRKSTSTSDFSFPSSGTEYHSLPISPEVSANMGPGNGSRSSIARLSDLNDMMRKFTSSSENDSAKDLPQGLGNVSGRGNWADYLSESRTPEDEPNIKYTHPSYEPVMPSSRFTGFEDHTTGDASSSRQWYLPAKPSSQSVGSLGAVHEDDSPNSMNLDRLDGDERFEGSFVSSSRSNIGNEEDFGGGEIQLPPRQTTQSTSPLGTLTEFVSADARKVEDVDGGIHRNEGIQLPPKPTTYSIGPLGSTDTNVSPDIRPDISDLVHQGPGTHQWYLPPKSSTQSMGSFGVSSSSSDISSPYTSNLQHPDPSGESRPRVQQWFVPPKSSVQSMGSPEGLSPDTSSLKNLENVFKTLQRTGAQEKWYLPMVHDSEKGESSPERSQLLTQQDVQKQTTSTASSSYTPAFLKSTLGGPRVMGESSITSSSTDSMTSPGYMGNEGNGTRGANTSMGEVFFSPSSQHKGGSDDGKASPASLSSGSLVSDTSNKTLSKSESSTTQDSEDNVKSDEEAPQRTGNEPGNHPTETETTAESTGSEISLHGVSTNTEAMEDEDLSYSNMYFGTDGSSATRLQDAFARRKQDFVKKSLARVERAKAKRFEVTPRVFVKKRVKPDKPVKPDNPVRLDKPVQSRKSGAAKKSTKHKK
ncbi:uncharacterized protein LOC116286393 [Actinia tenebrosa]|uniref:Uncharacterized protein LOC116286393 n=1 Tax=Actinia tenebrosa TaxID=6105 RepID=A0A6P8H7R1_ACTTE|nr:uncharacterized protein LOC116286393 [Actinia tenebrosa]